MPCPLDCWTCKPFVFVSKTFFRLDAINTKGTAGCRKQHSLLEDHLHLPSIKMPTKLRLLFDWGNQIKVRNVFFLPYPSIRLSTSSFILIKKIWEQMHIIAKFKMEWLNCTKKIVWIWTNQGWQLFKIIFLTKLSRSALSVRTITI